MKKVLRYLADLLTLTRLLLAIYLFVLAVTGGSANTAFIVFTVALITDMFDGTCAKKWPFPKNATPKYRKYAAQFDMVSDVMLAAAQVLFLLLRVNLVGGIVTIIFYAICALVELVLYGKFFGHPDNCTDWSLTKRNFPLAKKIVLARRFGYTICIGCVNAAILFATDWPTPAKVAGFLFGLSLYVFTFFFLQQRRKNVSRDAVEIEKKLSKRGNKK